MSIKIEERSVMVKEMKMFRIATCDMCGFETEYEHDLGGFYTMPDMWGVFRVLDEKNKEKDLCPKCSVQVLEFIS